MTENQKLREAIKRLLKAHRITVQAPPKTITDAENQIAEIQNAVNFAEEALALPTAEQVDDINVAESFTSVTKTAAPVGEREAFEREAVRSGYSVDKYAGTSIYADISTARAYEWWQSGRAALSAGDAVDGVPGVETVAWMFTDPPMMGGRTEFRTDPENVTPHWTPLSATAVVKQYKEDAQRYRWLREQSDDDFVFAVVKNPHFDVYESPEELDAAIDAAMRKGQL